MAKYVVRDAFAGFKRGDVIDNPSVVPEALLKRNCISVHDEAFGPAPAAKTVDGGAK